MAQRLNERLVRSLKAPENGYRITYDTKVAGFAVRVTRAGMKSFVLNYRASGRERRITIGRYPAWSVEAAREKASKLRHEIDSGGDPMSERAKAQKAPFVKDVCARYMKAHSRPKKGKASADYDQYLIDRYIVPAIGNRKLEQIEYGDVDALHRQITEYAPIIANRVVALLSKLFNLSIKWKYRIDNPAKGIERNPEQQRKRYLSGVELQRLIHALADYPYMEKIRVSRSRAAEIGCRSEWRRRESPDREKLQSANVIRLLLLTGARKGETLKAEWAQIDFHKGTWTKPGHTTKQKTDHRIPLSAPALQLLHDMPQQSEYVFPGRDGGHQTDIKRAWSALRDLADLGDFRIHDLRHNYASHLVSAGLTLPVIGELLGHTQPNTTARYAHLFDDPLRKATERVGAAITNAGQSGNVVELRR